MSLHSLFGQALVKLFVLVVPRVREMAVFSAFGQVEVIHALEYFLLLFLVLNVAVVPVLAPWQPYSLVAVISQINFLVSAVNTVTKLFIENVA